MTTKIVLPAINSDSSKAEEIAFLEKLAEKMLAGTYLADLFTPAFVGWVSNEIRNDFVPDMFSSLNARAVDAESIAAQRADRIRSLESLVESKNRLMEDAHAEFKRDVAALNERLAHKDARIASLAALNEDAEKTMFAMSQRNSAEQAALGQRLQEAMEEVLRLREEIERMKLEAQAFKANLLDSLISGQPVVVRVAPEYPGVDR